MAYDGVLEGVAHRPAAVGKSLDGSGVLLVSVGWDSAAVCPAWNLPFAIIDHTPYSNIGILSRMTPSMIMNDWYDSGPEKFKFTL